MGSNERGEMKSLLKRCRNGEPDAWNEFHRRFGARIHLWLEVAKPVSDGLTREAYVRISEDLESPRFGKSFEPALRRTVYGVAVSHLREEDASTGIHLGDEDDLQGAPSSSAKGLDISWHLLQAASRLSEDERNLLTIRYRDSLSYSEIAEQLRRDDVSSTLTRVLLRLADETQKLRLRTLSCAHDGVSDLLLPYAEGLLTGDDAEQARAHAASCPSFKNDAETIKNVSAALWVGYGTASLHPPVESVVAYAEAGVNPSAELREKVQVHCAFCAMCSAHVAAIRANVSEPLPGTLNERMPAALLQVVCPRPDDIPAPPPVANSRVEAPPPADDKPLADTAPRGAEQPRLLLPSALIAGVLVMVFGSLFVVDLIRGRSHGTDATKPTPLAIAASGASAIETRQPIAIAESTPPRSRPTRKPPVVKPSAIAKTPDAKPTVAKPPAAKPTVAKTPAVKPTVAKTPAVKPTVAKVPTAKPTVAKTPAAKPTVAKVPTAKPTVAKTPAAKPTVAKTPATKPTVAKTPTTKPLAVAAKKPAPAVATRKPTFTASRLVAKQAARPAPVFIPAYRPAPRPTAQQRHQWRLVRTYLPKAEKVQLRRLEAAGGKAIRQVLRDRPYAVEIGMDADLEIKNVTVTTTKQISAQQKERASQALASTLKVNPTVVTFDTSKLPPPTSDVYVYRPQPPAPIARELDKVETPRLTEPVTSVRIAPPVRPEPAPVVAPVRPSAPRPEPEPLTPPSPPTPTPH